MSIHAPRPAGLPATLHRAARLEDAIYARIAPRLQRRGWRPRVLAYTGYGSCASGDAGGWVRVLARVLLASPEAPRRTPELVRGWRSFVTVPVHQAELTVRVGDQVHSVRADRSGYVDAVVPADLAAGWHDVVLEAPGADAAIARTVLVAPHATWGLVSDIDDTVMVTSLPRPLLAFWNTFVLHEHARRPVPGMAAMYRDLMARDPDAPVVYLSTGAWNVAPTLQRFLERHGYPPGPLLLTDWGPTPEGWFRSGQAHKRASLARLARELPQVRWLLVGDDGQHDPQLYEEFTRRAPQNVQAVAIRQLSPAEQVLSHGTPVPAHAQQDATARAQEPSGTATPSVPWVQAPDGRGLREALRQRGVA